MSDTITQESSPMMYFHIIPNMADDDLDPYEYRLFGHYIRVCGANNKPCVQGIRKISSITKMSTGKVSEARKNLHDKGYILSQGGSRTSSFHVTIRDRWLENMQRYRPESDTGVHQVNTEEGKGCSPGERKNKQKDSPRKKNNSTYVDRVMNSLSVGSGQAGMIVSILADKSVKHAEFNCSPEVTESEFAACMKWKDGKYLPQKLSSIQTMIVNWRQTPQYAAWKANASGTGTPKKPKVYIIQMTVEVIPDADGYVQHEGKVFRPQWFQVEEPARTVFHDGTYISEVKSDD